MVLAAIALAGMALAFGAPEAMAQGGATVTTLSSSADPAEVGSSFTVTARSSINLYGTGMSLQILDADANDRVIQDCGNEWCTAQQWVSWEQNTDLRPRHFKSRIVDLMNQVVDEGPSLTVGVRRHDFAVDLTSDPGSAEVGGSFTLKATTGTNLYNTGLALQIVDLDHDDRVVAECGNDFCTSQQWVGWAETRIRGHGTSGRE